MLSRRETASTKQDASKEFEEEIRINPANAGTQFVLGELAREDSKTDEAISYFRQATELEAMFVDARLGLGRSLLEAGKPAEAVWPLERAVKLQPDHPIAHFQLATAYQRAGRVHRRAASSSCTRPFRRRHLKRWMTNGRPSREHTDRSNNSLLSQARHIRPGPRQTYRDSMLRVTAGSYLSGSHVVQLQDPRSWEDGQQIPQIYETVYPRTYQIRLRILRHTELDLRATVVGGDRGWANGCVSFSRLRNILTPRCRAALIALAALSACAQPNPSGSGPESLKRLTLEELSQVQVTSVTKAPVSAFTTRASISVLTSDQIRQSGAKTIPDLLRLMPGVNVAQISSSSWAVGIRGFESGLSRSVLVLIDGRSVYTPLFRGVYWDMQDVMIEDIDRIEVIAGPGGTIWGSNAVNGVINIITKNARETHGTLISAQAGNVEQGALAWRYGGGDDRFSYRVYGKGFTRGPQEHLDGKDFDDWRRGQLGFRADSRLSNRDEVTIQGDMYAAEGGEALQVSTYSPPVISTQYSNKEFNGGNLLAAWRRRLASGEIQIVTYWDRTNRRELNYQEIRNTFDIDFIHQFSISRHNITWGLGARLSPSEFTQVVPTVVFTPAHDRYNIYSTFLQDEIAIFPERLSLTLGSKFEHTSYSGFNYQPSGRLSWTPSARQTFWAAVSRAVRTASRIENGFQFTALQIPSLPLYLRLIGDNNFTPEQLIAYEAGYRNNMSKRFYVSLSLFHNRYNDLLSVENQPPFVESTPPPQHLILALYLRNGIAADSNGGEVAAVWDAGSSVRLRGSYSVVFINARRRAGSNDASTVRQLEGDSPAHVGVVESSFKLPWRFDLRLAYRAVSAIPDLSVPAYSTGDARIAWKSRGPWELEAVGQNLFQPWHFEYGGLPGGPVGIKRSVFAGLRWTR